MIMRSARIANDLIVLAAVLGSSAGGQSSQQRGNVAGTQAFSTVTPAQREAIAEAIRRATTEFLAAISSVDAEKAASFDSRSADFTFAGDDGSICRTPEVCHKGMKEGFDGLRSQEIRISDAKIAVLAPNVAVETMSAVGSFSTKAGKTMVIDKSAFTMVWVREAEGWKVLVIHQSFLPPKAQ
jgi:ketosteroid isomerase-like protein